MDELKGAFDRQYYKISRAFVDGQPVGNLTGTTSSTTSRCTG
jgi:hypothetical protein